MTIKLSDEALEAIVEKAVYGFSDGYRDGRLARAAIDATLAHLSRQQGPEPDRFLVLAREVIALHNEALGAPDTAHEMREGRWDHELPTLATYLREQCEADRAGLLERIEASLADQEWVGNSLYAAIRKEFAR